MRPALIIAAGFAVLPILSGAARAQANRTFVSGHGSDTNSCSLAAPCRSFAQALTQTSAGGEITILDPAGYGPVTINKAVSIVNDGVGEAGVTVTSATSAITVNVGASDVVNLRGLTLVGGGVGFDGIVFTNLGALNIQNCVIRGFTNDGIDLGTGSAVLNVLDTIVSNNVNFGVQVSPNGSGTVRAVFNRVQAIGIAADSGGGTTQLMVSSSGHRRIYDQACCRGSSASNRRSAADLDGAHRGCFDPIGAERPDQAHDTQAGAEPLLGMRPPFQD
jgi:hypothetical protein